MNFTFVYGEAHGTCKNTSAFTFTNSQKKKIQTFWNIYSSFTEYKLKSVAFWRYLYKWDDFTSIHFCKVCKVPQMLYMVLMFKYVCEISYVTIQMKPLQQYFNMVL